jgi:hypothetical protein
MPTDGTFEAPQDPVLERVTPTLRRGAPPQLVFKPQPARLGRLDGFQHSQHPDFGHHRSAKRRVFADPGHELVAPRPFDLPTMPDPEDVAKVGVHQFISLCTQTRSS